MLSTKDFCRSLIMAVHQLKDTDYKYITQHLLQGLPENSYVFQSCLNPAQALYFSLPIIVNDGDFANLGSRVKGIIMKPSFSLEHSAVQWILPVIWNQHVDHGGFADDVLSGVGLLVLTPHKMMAQWIGAVTPGFSTQLGEILVNEGFSAAEGDDCLDLKSEVMPSISESDPYGILWELFCDLDQFRSKTPAILPSLSIIDFDREKKAEFGKMGCLVEPVLSAFEQLEGIDRSATLIELCRSLSDILSKSIELPPFIRQQIIILSDEHQNTPIERVGEFSRYIFSCMLSLLLQNREFIAKYHQLFARFIRKYGEFYTITVFVSQVISAMVCPKLPAEYYRDAVETMFKSAITVAQDVALLKLRFYGVYQQLLNEIDRNKEDGASALENITNYLIAIGIPFDKTQPRSFEVAIGSLNKFFFEWSDQLERFFRPIPTDLTTREGDYLLGLFTNIADYRWGYNATLLFVARFLDQLSPALSGLDKTIEDYTVDIDEMSPRLRYDRYQDQQRVDVTFRSYSSREVSVSSQAEVSEPNINGDVSVGLGATAVDGGRVLISVLLNQKRHHRFVPRLQQQHLY